MGLLDAARQYLNDAAPGGLLNPEWTPERTDAAKGLLGLAPVVGDAVSAFDAIQSARAGQWGDAALNAVGLVPLVPSLGGMVIPKKALQESLERLQAMQRGEHAKSVLKEGLLTTDLQRRQINDAYSSLTSGKQPPFQSNALDIALGHIYDARVSGKVKPSGMKADRFDPRDVTKWMESAGADSAVVGVRDGKPHLQNTYIDPITGESFVVRMPISADFATGRQWVGGLIPEGKFKKD